MTYLLYKEHFKLWCYVKMESNYLLIYTTKGSHIFRGVHRITKLHVTVNEQSWKPGNYQFLVISQVLIGEATLFREATIIREATFLKVHVHIKDIITL